MFGNSAALFTVAALSFTVPSSPFLNEMRKAYAADTNFLLMMNQVVNSFRISLPDLPPLYLSSLDRYTSRKGLMYYTAITEYTPRVVVPDHDVLRLRIMFE